MTGLTDEALRQVVHEEALALDARDFAGWLDLYTQDAVFWVPAWTDDMIQTQDPRTQLSLIYYEGRDNLRDRVDRMLSGSSPVSRRLPRVTHILSNVLIRRREAQAAVVHSSFATYAFYPRTDTTAVHFGQYEHSLVAEGGNWLISKKIVRLANDIIPTVLDINAI